MNGQDTYNFLMKRTGELRFSAFERVHVQIPATIFHPFQINFSEAKLEK